MNIESFFVANFRRICEKDYAFEWTMKSGSLKLEKVVYIIYFYKLAQKIWGPKKKRLSVLTTFFCGYFSLMNDLSHT